MAWVDQVHTTANDIVRRGSITYIREIYILHVLRFVLIGKNAVWVYSLFYLTRPEGLLSLDSM